MVGRTLLHVGMHKTGSTSIQSFLHDHAALLAEVGATCPQGFLIPNLHADLPLLTLRADRVWPARIRFPETQDPGWQAAAAAHVRAVATTAEPLLVIWSHEDLAYVRHDDELERLRNLLGAAPVQVVIYRRERADFLRSYRRQLEMTGFEPSDDTSSFAYVGSDSWVADHEAVVATYERGFGVANVTVIDYDEAVRRDRSVIPSFTDLVGLQRASLPRLDSYFFNQAGGQVRLSEEHLAAIRRRAVEQSRR